MASDKLQFTSPREERAQGYEKLFARQEKVIAEQHRSLQEYEQTCLRLRKTIRGQKNLLDSFVNLSGLISFKMADLANVAIKLGYYSEAVGDEHWIDQFTSAFIEMREQENVLQKGDEYSYNFDPFVRFLNLVKEKKEVF